MNTTRTFCLGSLLWFWFNPAQVNGHAALSPGLVVRATDGARNVVYVTPTANFNLNARQSIHPQLQPQFKAEWNGFLKVVRSGKYSIHGDAKILVGGEEAQEHPMELEAGELPLRIEYQRKPGTQARLQLRWESDFFKLEPIPASVLGHTDEPAEVASHVKLTRGRELIEDLNCVACHKTDSTLWQTWRGPSLTAIGARASTNWLFHWLQNPRRFRPSAVMPDLLENDQERADVTAYLASLRDSKSKVRELESSDAQVSQGKALFQGVGCLACHGEAGVSLAGMGSKMSAGHLAKYLVNPLTIDPSGRMPDLGLKSDEAERIALWLVQSKNPDFEKPSPAGDADRGRQLVSARGCVNCHALRDPSGQITNTLSAPRFGALAANKGCLAERPAGAAPRFDLSAEDRESITACLSSPDLSEAPTLDFQRWVKRFNCAGCHEWNGPARLTFEVNQSPPPLTDAGNKLRRSWLDQVLTQKKRIRPWMTLRMPHYGPTNVGALVDLFAAQAGADLGEGEKIDKPTAEQAQAGAKLIGRDEGGLSCINCHDYRGETSGGEMRGPDLTEMYDRIRADWLWRWLREPGRVQPGTAMPAFFSEMPEAQAQKSISALIQALAVGRALPIPPGLGEAAQAYFLLVKDEPIVFRTFIEDSSPHSIAVGLPGQNSFVFDAQLCRLRYAWAGDFLDVKPVWTDRGGQQAKILGERYYTAPNMGPLRIGNPEQEPKVKFKGYRLVNRIPEFLYEVDGVAVREWITNAQQGMGLFRSFEIGVSDREIWFVAGASEAVAISCSAGSLVEGRIRIAAGGPVQFDVTMTVK